MTVIKSQGLAADLIMAKVRLYYATKRLGELTLQKDKDRMIAVISNMKKEIKKAERWLEMTQE